MRMMIAGLMATALLGGCETETHSYAREHEESLLKIKAIPVGQPVDQANADLLAYAYWRRYCPICGVVYPVRDEGRYWAADVYAGYVPTRRPDLLIEKSTGTIFWSRGPTITNWSELE